MNQHKGYSTNTAPFSAPHFSFQFRNSQRTRRYDVCCEAAAFAFCLRRRYLSSFLRTLLPYQPLVWLSTSKIWKLRYFCPLSSNSTVQPIDYKTWCVLFSVKCSGLLCLFLSLIDIFLSFKNEKTTASRSEPYQIQSRWISFLGPIIGTESLLQRWWRRYRPKRWHRA